MTGYDTLKGEILADVDAVYQQGVTDGTASQTSADSAAISALNATVASLTAEEALDEKTIADLKAQIAILQGGSGGGTTPPSGNYGGTTGWGTPTVVDLTKAPTGTTYTSKVRTSTDQTYNRQEQAKFAANGLTITAARSGSTIFSADVMMRGIVLPAQFAIEADIEMQGTGPGMGHAFWARPLSGEGEIDFLEYIGSNSGKGIAGGKGKFESKTTLINTGSPYNQGSDANGIPPMADGTYNGVRRYRAELTADQFSEWVDGKLVWTETKAAFEKTAGAGKWSQFAGSTKWYPRLTLQAGNGASAKLWGTVPADFLSATIRLGALRVYARA